MRFATYCLVGALLCAYASPARADSAPEPPPSPEEFAMGGQRKHMFSLSRAADGQSRHHLV
jgi:hypothetical protein